MKSMICTNAATVRDTPPSSPKRTAFAELLMGNALNDLVNQCNDKHFSDVYYNRQVQALLCTRRYWMNNRGVSVNQPNQSWPYFLYFGTSLPVSRFDGSKDAFIGRWRGDGNPEAVEKGSCFNTEITSGDPCAALQSELTLNPGQNMEFSVVMGLAEKPSLNSNDPNMFTCCHATGDIP